jgi:CspA family cold shock protein
MPVGEVIEFDDAAGFGTVRTSSGEFFFHCTAIADGTRTIVPGAKVSFEVVAGRRGQWEAAAIEPA